MFPPKASPRRCTSIRMAGSPTRPSSPWETSARSIIWPASRAENTNNIAIVTFNAVRDDQDPSKMQAFVRVANFRPRAAQVELELESLVNGQIKGHSEESR